MGKHAAPATPRATRGPTLRGPLRTVAGFGALAVVASVVGLLAAGVTVGTALGVGLGLLVVGAAVIALLSATGLLERSSHDAAGAQHGTRP